MKLFEKSKRLHVALVFLLYGIRSSAEKNDGTWRNTDDSTTLGIGTIQMICVQTQNPSFCSSVFTKDPRYKSTDNLNIFGQIATDATAQSLLAVYNKVKTLVDRNRDPALKGSLEGCQILYRLSNSEIKNANLYLAIPANFKALGTGISGRAKDCENKFESSGLPSPLASENGVVADFGNIIEVIGSLLSRKLSQSV